jgi:hypothetical protein
LVAPRHVEIDGDCAVTLAVTGYPAEVAPGWLEPLTSYPGRLDIALHIEPVPPAVAADRLRRQRARLESSRRTWAGQGRLDDPATEAAAEDARALAYQVARGEGKLFRLGLYLTVHGTGPDDLAGQVAGVRALADSLLLSTAPATYRSLQGWVTTLPAGTDALKLRRTMDTAALAAAFPFSSPDLPRDPADPDALPGVLYGASASGPGLVAWDRWACDNHNSVTLATSGAGKSYLGKLEISRQLYQGTECWVVDPEDEYARLCAALGGAYIHLGAPGVHLNPFDLPDPARARPDALTRRALFLHTVIAVLTGADPAPAEKAALDKAIMAAYHAAGISSDRRTWARPAPLLAGLAAALRADATPPALALADRLVPYTEGTHSAMFSAPTTTRPAGHLVVFSLRDLPEELKAIGTLLALDATWRRVSDPAARGRRRLITVDEAWLLMRDPEGARFLFRMAKASRKHHAGLAAITQDAEDVLAADLGRAVIANSATQILLRQSPRPSPRSPPSSGCPPESAPCCCPRPGEPGSWRPGRPPGSRSKPWPRRRKTPGARQIRPRSPACKPASPPPRQRNRCPATPMRTCCHDRAPGGRGSRAGRAAGPVRDRPRRDHRPPGPAAAARPGRLGSGRRPGARPGRRRGARRAGAPAAPPPPGARRRRPAGGHPGPAASRPGRR